MHFADSYEIFCRKLIVLNFMQIFVHIFLVHCIFSKLICDFSCAAFNFAIFSIVIVDIHKTPDTVCYCGWVPYRA